MTMPRLIFAAALAVAVSSPAGAQGTDRPMLDQDVAKSSFTITPVTIGTTFSAVETTKLAGSFFVEVQNLSTERVCCTFDSAASGAAVHACQRIDTAATSARPTATDWKVWKRWAQNLSLYCRSMKGLGGTADIIVTQGK